MKNIQMNTSVSPELRTQIQKQAGDIGLTASDALALLPGALSSYKKECLDYTRDLLTGKATRIPLCYLLTYFGMDIRKDGGRQFATGQNLSFERLYRFDLLEVEREYECTLLTTHAGEVFIGDVYDDNGVFSIDGVFTLKRFWDNVRKYFKDENGLWIEDVPFFIGGSLMLTFKKGNK